MPFVADSHLNREVAGQPDDWAAVVTRLDEVASALPRRGVASPSSAAARRTSWPSRMRGCASSGDTGRRMLRGQREPAGARIRARPRSDPLGNTTEVLEVLRALRERGVPTTVVTAVPGSPAAELADQVVLLPEVDEQSVVQTRFATSALALLRASLGEDLAAAVDDARAVLAEPEEAALAGLVDVEQVTFVGTGWSVGLAEEAALKLRESAQFWTESYPAMEYRHGPIAIAAPGRATWAFGPVPDGMREQVAATGAHFEHRDLDPLAELVRVHRLCLAKARQADVDPDHPRHLTRSVVLEQP